MAHPKKTPNDRAGLAQVDYASVALTPHRHDLAGVSDTGRAGFSDGSPGGSLDLTGIELTGQKAFDDGDLLAFFLSQIGPVSLLIKRDRFATLLDHRLQHSADFGFGKTLRVPLRTRCDIPVFEPGNN